MLIVIARARALPECMDDLAAAAGDMVASTRTDEGCKSYGFLGRRLAGVDLSDYGAVRRALQFVRDLILDNTPLLQKVVGESSPREALKQIDIIDEAETAFTAIRQTGAR